jgi:FlaA1/EpsC-like NDP-sugar epimerase
MEDNARLHGVPYLILRRSAFEACLDGLGWALAFFLVLVSRFDFAVGSVDFRRAALFLPLVVVTQLVTGTVCGLYTGRWSFASFEQVKALSASALLTSAGVAGLDLVLGNPRPVPLSTTIGAGFVAIVWMSGWRYASRMRREARSRPDGQDMTRVLVFGAGEGGYEVIKAMIRGQHGPYLPVAILDDDPTKRNLRILGVPVVGGRHALREAVDRFGPDVLLIAIPSARSALIADTTRLAREAGLEVKVLPRVSEILRGTADAADMRDVTEADLLGRAAVQTDLSSVAGYVTGKRVLVTGAGGSIGSELCRQLKDFAPSELVMADHDGSALHAVQLAVDGAGLLDSPDVVVLDIRDRARVQQLFGQRSIQVVFHAAALKHLPLLERYPGEALETNVKGTFNVLEAAASSGVERFVNISTDKAADPVSVLGYSKRLAERMTAYMAARADGAYLSVRFGNVLGSRGSMLETFQTQIASGGPITVTHPEVSRYFMTVEEAVQLVIQAATIGSDGDALVLDMGEPVRIADIARMLAEQAGGHIDVILTGLRPGEKVHEVLFGTDEVGMPAVHPLISSVRVPPLDPSTILDLDPLTDATLLAGSLRDACGIRFELCGAPAGIAPEPGDYDSVEARAHRADDQRIGRGDL